jgi:hypothetical protein
MWRQSFGSDFVFRILSCRSTAKGAPWASFRSLRSPGGFGKPPTHTGAHWGYGNSANPFLSAVLFRPPSLLPCPPGRFVFRSGPDRHLLELRARPMSREHALPAHTPGRQPPARGRGRRASPGAGRGHRPPYPAARGPSWTPRSTPSPSQPTPVPRG